MGTFPTLLHPHLPISRSQQCWAGGTQEEELCWPQPHSASASTGSQLSLTTTLPPPSPVGGRDGHLPEVRPQFPTQNPTCRHRGVLPRVVHTPPSLCSPSQSHFPDGNSGSTSPDTSFLRNMEVFLVRQEVSGVHQVLSGIKTIRLRAQCTLCRDPFFCAKAL